MPTRQNAPANRLVIGLAQIDCTVGDIAGNVARMRAARAEAAAFGADLVMFSELFIAGYPPEDLVLKPAFLEACRAACEEIAAETADGGPAILVGLPWGENGHCYNAYALLDKGRIEAVRFKADLPNYGVFDEKRVFTPGPMPGPVSFKRRAHRHSHLRGYLGTGPGRMPRRCEAAKFFLFPTVRLTGAARRTSGFRSPPRGLPRANCRSFISISSAARTSLSSMARPSASMPIARARSSFRLFRPWSRRRFGSVEQRALFASRDHAADIEEGDEADYAACVLGLRDYVNKNGFPGVVMGLSGGIDSALCAAMAVDALGPERVHCVMLPYRFTSNESLKDAEACARALKRSLRYICRSRRRSKVLKRSLRQFSRAAMRISPRKISKAARVARC